MTGIIRIALFAVLAYRCCPARVAHAQDAYPTRTVRFVVPFPAGSGTDVLSRLLADAAHAQMGPHRHLRERARALPAISARSTSGAPRRTATR